MARKANDKFNARPYMELAIEEMKKSINEPRQDGKVAPKVGAIAVFPNGDIERAYRGELREGDHAEYNLLERKLANRKLDDCVLFTTLEPCVVRNPPKIACCVRTSNARIKTVYVGIEDPDKTVDGKGIKHLENKGVKVFMFDRDLQKIIEDENSDFIKQANERKNKKSEPILPDNEFEKIVPNASISDLSRIALSKFIKEANLKYKLDAKFNEYLVNLGALKYDTKAKKYRPTGFGILLFGNNPRVKYKQAALMAYVDYGEGKVEPKTFDQPLILIPSLVEEWLKKALPLSKDTKSFKRRDVPSFPIDVLREVVINAIVHRDYSLEGSKSSLEIDNDKIKIKSPGAPLPSISLDQLNTFSAPSISRNPIITYVFGLMNYVEEKGFGMKTIKSLYEEYGLPLPEYSMEGLFLTLTFPRSIQAVRKISKLPQIARLSNEELRGYEWIKSKDEISSNGYAKQMEIDPRTARRHLSNMLGLKLIQTNGESSRSPKLRYGIKILPLPKFGVSGIKTKKAIKKVTKKITKKVSKPIKKKKATKNNKIKSTSKSRSSNR